MLRAARSEVPVNVGWPNGLDSPDSELRQARTFSGLALQDARGDMMSTQRRGQ